jgi:hypothetical protein
VAVHPEVAIGPPFPTPFIGEEDLEELNSEVTDKLVPQNDTPVFQEEQAMKSPVTEEQSTSEKSRDGKKEKSNNPGPAAAGFLGLSIHLFDRDSTKQEVVKEDKKGLFAFLKDSTRRTRIRNFILLTPLSIPNATHRCRLLHRSAAMASMAISTCTMFH